MDLWIDFETYSEVDLSERGSMAYAKDPSTNVLCMGYAIDDEPAHVWTPDKVFPQEVIDAVLNRAYVYAHNATFDFRIWNYVLIFAYPEVPPLILSQVRDTRAIASTFTLPASLADAGAAMRITMPKNPIGKKLIKILCCPNAQGDQPLPMEARYHNEFKQLYEYCRRDIEAMREFVKALPRQHLLDIEQRVWEMTYEMNSTGLPVAYHDILTIRAYLLHYIQEQTKSIPLLTRGIVERATQTQRIKAWCEGQGYVLEDLTSAAVSLALQDDKCPGPVRKILEMRQLLGRTSVAKFSKLSNLMCRHSDGTARVYDNSIYHGASTGRWSGCGFQMLNLPRAQVKDPEAAIRQFYSGQVEGDPVALGKALIRPMIKAPPGYTLIVSDYSSIENRILAWLAGDVQTLTDFWDGKDQYKTMASFLYKVPYDEVTKDQRQMGKVIILGCGYSMGPVKFKDTAKAQFNMDISSETAKQAVDAYREKYALIVELWHNLKRACYQAVTTCAPQHVGRITFATATVKGTRWLAMQLPSAKCIYYKNPSIEMRHIPGYEHKSKVATVIHEGINPYSKKWSRLALIPGRITENAVQGTAREVLAQGMLNIRANMPHIALLGCVHDEVVGMLPTNCIQPHTMDDFNTQICSIPWADDCPLAAAGYLSERYKKE